MMRSPPFQLVYPFLLLSLKKSMDTRQNFTSIKREEYSCKDQPKVEVELNRRLARHFNLITGSPSSKWFMSILNERVEI